MKIATLMLLFMVFMSDIVYKTKYGQEYHSRNCCSLYGQTIYSLYKSDAIKQRLQPCQRCIYD